MLILRGLWSCDARLLHQRRSSSRSSKVKSKLKGLCSSFCMMSKLTHSKLLQWRLSVVHLSTT